MRSNYNVIPKWFSGNQLLPSMANSIEINLKKKAPLNVNQKSLEMSPATKKENWEL